LLTDKQTNKQTKSGKNITSLAEVIMNHLINNSLTDMANYVIHHTQNRCIRTKLINDCTIPLIISASFPQTL